MLLLNKIIAKIDTKWTRWRFRRKNGYIPFYDDKKGIYRVFFDDRYDEFGSIDYVVGEYTNTGLIYHFSIRGEIDHEHSFNAILRMIMDCKGIDFSINGYESEYSQQEIEMMNKYIELLNKDNK